jgi:hypothetical protein
VVDLTTKDTRNHEQKEIFTIPTKQHIAQGHTETTLEQKAPSTELPSATNKQ